MYIEERYKCTVPFREDGLLIQGDFYAKTALKLATKESLEKHGYFYIFDKSENKKEYMPSCTLGDYAPSHPWDAPGMSIRDFI